MQRNRCANWAKSLFFLAAIFELSSCKIPFQLNTAESPPANNELAERIEYSGASFSLNWEYTPESTGLFTIFYRIHGNEDWIVLAQDLVEPALTVTTMMLDYGEYDFAVIFTSELGMQTDFHYSLEMTAVPAKGWYLAWSNS